MKAALATNAMDVTYAEVEKLVYDTIHKFIRRYGGEWNELLSVCHLAFTNAVYEYDGTRSSFVTKVRWNCWKDMEEFTRRNLVRLSRVAVKDLKPHDAVVDERSAFAELFQTLSCDAKIVTRLVTEAPDELARAIGAKVTKSRLKEFLKGWGWSVARISETFNEIGKALK